MLLKNLKIAVAVTFSPTGKLLLREAVNISKKMQGQLYLINISSEPEESQKEIVLLIKEMGVEQLVSDVTCLRGDVAKLLTTYTRKMSIGLLILGALEKEDLLKYYVGSIARTIMRDAPCSLLILTPEMLENPRYDIMAVNVDYSPEGTNVIRYAYDLSKILGTNEIILIREISAPGLSISIHETGSVAETESVRQQWQKDEKLKLDLLIRELNLSGTAIKKVCLFGKQGFEAYEHVKNSSVNLYVIAAPEKKLRLIDRIFQHDQEYLFKELPCSLLLLKEPSH